MSITHITTGAIRAGSLLLPGVQQFVLRVPLSPTATSAIVSTGKKIPADAVVEDVFVVLDVASSAATPQINVGTAASISGFVAGLLISSTGVKRASSASGSATRGTLLRETGDASSIPAPFVSTAEIEIAYKTHMPDAALRGHLYIPFRLYNP